MPSNIDGDKSRDCARGLVCLRPHLPTRMRPTPSDDHFAMAHIPAEGAAVTSQWRPAWNSVRLPEANPRAKWHPGGPALYRYLPKFQTSNLPAIWLSLAWSNPREPVDYPIPVIARLAWSSIARLVRSGCVPGNGPNLVARRRSTTHKLPSAARTTLWPSFA